MKFIDKAHRDFYIEKVAELNADTYLRTLIYTLGICPDTRRNFNSIYDAKAKCIFIGALNNGWQTSGSLKVTRLAFELFTDTVLIPKGLDSDEANTERSQYYVTNLFCCEYAIFFVEALKIRFPDYFLVGV